MGVEQCCRALLRYMRLVAVAALVLQLSAPASAAEIAGHARIIDGDTIDVGTVRVRLHGIDAPEGRQTCQIEARTYQCGEMAAMALANLIGTHWVDCIERDRDQYGRTVAVCYLAGRTIDVNREIVRQGWALAYRQFSRDYVDAEAEAKQARAGMWAGTFQPPWEYRRR